MELVRSRARAAIVRTAPSLNDKTWESRGDFHASNPAKESCGSISLGTIGIHVKPLHGLAVMRCALADGPSISYLLFGTGEVGALTSKKSVGPRAHHITCTMIVMRISEP
jgi:hypothetical protein